MAFLLLMNHSYCNAIFKLELIFLRIQKKVVHTMLSKKMREESMNNAIPMGSKSASDKVFG
jgi:hypothetical protein